MTHCFVKKLFLFPIVFFLSFLAPLPAYTQEEDEYPVERAKEPSGEGTQENPYEISSIEHLLWIAGEVNSKKFDFTDVYFEQTQDIDMSETRSWNGGKGWKPIGGYYYINYLLTKVGFKGIYDGKNYTIRGLYENRPQAIYGGLFGYVSGGELKNIRIEAPEILVSENAACLLAYLFDGKVTNCHVVGGSVEAALYVGGVVGYIYSDAVVYGCSSSATVKGQDWIGSIVGWSSEGTVEHCTAQGTVIARDNGRYAGGVVGYVMRSKVLECRAVNLDVQGNVYVGGIAGGSKESEIARCLTIKSTLKGDSFIGGVVGAHEEATLQDSYSTATVEGNTLCGGLVGRMAYSTASIKHCFSASRVESTDASCGAFMGAKAGGVVMGCYYASDTNTALEGVGGTSHADVELTALNSEAMQKAASFKEWDFANTWVITQGLNHPELKWHTSFPSAIDRISNPFNVWYSNGALRFYCPNEATLSFTLYDICGREVYNGQIVQSIPLVLEPGVYFVRVNTTVIKVIVP